MREIYIVTGLSGSGKSTAMKVLEDRDFYCIDNIPPSLIISFENMSNSFSDISSSIAFGIDVRSGNSFSDLSKVLDYFDNKKLKYNLIFIDAKDEVLIKRYKQTRRKHPFFSVYNDNIESLFKKEREILEYAKNKADIVINTTDFTEKDFKTYIYNNVLFNPKSLTIRISSFGFKYSIPKSADIIYDVRCLPNPYYIDLLKSKTGLDKEVRDYIMKFDVSQKLLEKFNDILSFSLPLYEDEGKLQIEIAIGCTGGKHRSVTFVEYIYKYLKENNFKVSKFHRDIEKV